MTAKIRTNQAAIGIQNRDQCDVGKVMPLGQHLGAQQYAGLAAVRCVKYLLHGAFASGAIAIYTQHLGIGKALL